MAIWFVLALLIVYVVTVLVYGFRKPPPRRVIHKVTEEDLRRPISEFEEKHGITETRDDMN